MNKTPELIMKELFEKVPLKVRKRMYVLDNRIWKFPKKAKFLWFTVKPNHYSHGKRVARLKWNERTGKPTVTIIHEFVALAEELEKAGFEVVLDIDDKIYYR